MVEDYSTQMQILVSKIHAKICQGNKTTISLELDMLWMPSSREALNLFFLPVD